MSIAEVDQTTDYAEHLREIAVGCRLSKTRWGITKALDADYKEEAANVFGANAKQIAASKKLIDTKNPKYKAVSSVFSQVTEYWKEHSLPFPEPGLRLMRREHVEDFDRRISQFQTELDGAVAVLQQDNATLLAKAEQDLGRLYSLSDYPASLEGLFRITVEYPSVEPDPSLIRVNATLYQRECQRVRSRFDEAVQLAEQSFAEEFRALVSHICERLEGLNDGTAKRFDERNLSNLESFFDRFRSLSIGSNAGLETLINDAKQAVRGYQPDWLEDSQPLRDVVRSNLDQVQQALDELMVARPKRRISWED